jgi:antitoxin MazE
MKSRIQQWGNSLALRIPKAMIEEAGLSLNAEVELVLVEGELVIKPSYKRRYTLEELVSKITEDNVHEETDWGDPQGNEAW